MNIQEAIKEKTVIHCKTEEEAKRILKMADELGYKWCYGRSYTDGGNNWRIYECETCYYIINGAFGDIKFFKDENYTIINSTEITDIKTTTDMKQELTITPPEGYEIDEENSTFQKIVFRKIKPKFSNGIIKDNVVGRCPECGGDVLGNSGAGWEICEKCHTFY